MPRFQFSSPPMVLGRPDLNSLPTITGVHRQFMDDGSLLGYVDGVVQNPPAFVPMVAGTNVTPQVPVMGVPVAQTAGFAPVAQAVPSAPPPPAMTMGQNGRQVLRASFGGGR